MPSNVKLFLWLNLVATGVACFPFAWELMRPHDAGVKWISGIFFAWRALILFLAWIAVFYRANWARILFTALVVGTSLAEYVLSRPGEFDSPDLIFVGVWGLYAAALVTVFTGNAREWFGRAA